MVTDIYHTPPWTLWAPRTLTHTRMPLSVVRLPLGFFLPQVDYMKDKLVRDPAFRRQTLGKICTVGASIEAALGSAQDIEGVVEVDGTITVVQTRPQV